MTETVKQIGNPASGANQAEHTSQPSENEDPASNVIAEDNRTAGTKSAPSLHPYQQNYVDSIRQMKEVPVLHTVAGAGKGGPS